MRQRTLPHGNVPLNCKGKSLLVGNIFCAHCGNRLTLTTSGRRVYRADGTVKYEPRMRYQCHYNVRHPGECDGQSGYGVTKLDGIVEKVIRMKFAEIAAAPESEILNHQHKKEIELARIKLDQANAHLAEKQKDLSDYKAETLKVIRGQSNLSVELLNALVKETETMIALAQTRIDAAQAEYESLLASAENLRQEYDRLLTWADLFDTCSFEAKKMIVAQFVKAVHVSRDYNIEIDFNVSFEEFQNFSVKNGGASHFATAAFAYRIKKFGIIRILSDYPVFGKQHPFRSLDLKSPEISRVFAFPASQSSLVSRAE